MDGFLHIRLDRDTWRKVMLHGNISQRRFHITSKNCQGHNNKFFAVWRSKGNWQECKFTCVFPWLSHVLERYHGTTYSTQITTKFLVFGSSSLRLFNEQKQPNVSVCWIIIIISRLNNLDTHQSIISSGMTI